MRAWDSATTAAISSSLTLVLRSTSCSFLWLSWAMTWGLRVGLRCVCWR
jgi:hypothetical protein